jgi:CheY-like chemotaxis protein
MNLITERRSILVVEDNAADADLVADALDGAPSAPRLVIAASSSAALELLSDRDPEALPSVVLLDLNLPGLGGLETLAQIKTDPALRRIPVVVLTTSKSQDEIDRCYELGAAAVLNKPLRLSEYRDMLGAFERFWLGHVRLPSGERRLT